MRNGLLPGIGARGRILPPLGLPRRTNYLPPTYPFLSPATTTRVTVAAAATTVNLPEKIRYGDILIGILKVEAGITITLPTGYVEMDSFATASGSFFYRLCDGTELDTVDFTPSGSTRADAIVWRVRAAERKAPTFGSVAANTATAWNAGAVTLAGTVAKPCLLMALGSAAAIPPGPVADYSDYEGILASGDDTLSGNGTLVFGIYRRAVVLSENPAGNTGGNVTSWSAITVALEAASSKGAMY